MVSLLSGLLYASLQLSLDNRENKNSRNVCVTQLRENIVSRKFLLIQYGKYCQCHYITFYRKYKIFYVEKLYKHKFSLRVALKASSLMSNRGCSQNFQNLSFFCIFHSFPPRSTLPLRNKAEIILVWKKSNFHRKPCTQDFIQFDIYSSIWERWNTKSCITWKRIIRINWNFGNTLFCLYHMIHAIKRCC